MKNNFKSMLAIAVAAAVAIIMFNVSSCNKATTTDVNQKFIGSWKGTDCNGTTTLVVTAGLKPNQINIAGTHISEAKCYRNIVLAATVSGDNFTILPQSIYDNCGTVDTASGSGSISGADFNMTTSVKADTGSIDCAFKGQWL